MRTDGQVRIRGKKFQPEVILQRKVFPYYLLVVLDEAVRLSQLGSLVGEMAGKEKVIARLDHPGKAHEQERVNRESARHFARDELRVLLEVGDSSQRQTPVGN